MKNFKYFREKKQNKNIKKKLDNIKNLAYKLNKI